MAIIQRAKINPKSLTHADVMQLQRTIGNRAVGKLLTEIGLIPSKPKQTQPVQMQTIPEEEKEPLQGKMVETVQRQEIPEEEEPLQGKMIEPIQRQEIPKEEEPLQGKFESIQRQEIPEEKEPLQGKFAEPIQRQEIPEEDEPLQGKFENKSEQKTCPSCSTLPIQWEKENRTGMPNNLKAGVENLSGIDMSDVRVHYNSDKPAEVGALAYAQGTDIHVAPGQEKNLPHEAWHVVQQKQGLVQSTTQMNGLGINDDPSLEHEADMMGAKTTQFVPSPDEEMLQGMDIQVAPGQEKHLAREAWHVVQQDLGVGAGTNAHHPGNKAAPNRRPVQMKIEKIGSMWKINNPNVASFERYKTREEAENVEYNEWRSQVQFKVEGLDEGNWKSQILMSMRNFDIDVETRINLIERAIKDQRPKPKVSGLPEYPFSDLTSVPEILFRYCSKPEADSAQRDGIKHYGGIDYGIPTTPLRMKKEEAKTVAGIVSADACISIATKSIPEIAQRKDNSLRKTTAKTGVEYKVLVDIPASAIERIY
jgi:hypothetical protein